jgi:hypothetical protein
VRRSEIDDCAPRVTRVTQIGQSALDAMHALFDRHLRQTNKKRFGQSGRGINLGLYRNSIDADERESVQLGEHERRILEIHRGEVRKTQALLHFGRLYSMPWWIANDFERIAFFSRWFAEQAADATCGPA